MGKRKKQRKPTPKPRDWNMVGLITRSGGKGRHQSKKHKSRAASKQALRKSLMDVKSSHGAFFMSAKLVFELIRPDPDGGMKGLLTVNPVTDPAEPGRSLMS